MRKIAKANVVSAYPVFSNHSKLSTSDYLNKQERHKNRNTVTDICDKCFKKILIARRIFPTRIFGNKIYCADCYFNKKGRNDKGAKWCGIGEEFNNMLLRKIEKSNKKNISTPPIIYQKPNTTSKFGVKRNNGIIITPWNTKK